MFLRFFKTETASGVVLIGAALFAMMAANSPWALEYALATGAAAHAINDGLMVIFFLLIGLEIKREFVEGELATRAQALLPVVAACGGVALPAAIFLAFNHGTEAARGWAIPSATDIAFSLGVLALAGNRVPLALKVFLMAVAVIDDLIAVVVIALFYTAGINEAALAGAGAAAALLLAINRAGVGRIGLYALAGAVLWYFVLCSGVHATIAGVVLGLLIPLRDRAGASVAGRLEHGLHPWVAFGIIPLFAFANAGVPLSGMSAQSMLQPLPLGIALGLFAGKQLGIFAAAWVAVRLGLAQRPVGAGWLAFYAVCMIAGIGFTMSLFIGTLAFADSEMMVYTRAGVLAGSVASAVLGYGLLVYALKGKQT